MTYEEKKKEAIRNFLEIKSKGPVSLKPKFTSHFFRTREKKNKLDLTMFDQVINVDVANQIVEVEGLCTFHDLAKETLKYGMLPVITPELRNITIGGTISGLGLESSSFKYGMVHNSVLDCEVLTSSGEVLKCSREENSDLFHILPNSLGSVGYVLKCRFKLMKASKYVKVKFIRSNNSQIYFNELRERCDSQSADFIDGIIFSTDHLVRIEGNLVDEIPSNTRLINFNQEIYWKFIKDEKHSEIYMNNWDYLWRWDADAFWAVSYGELGKITENKLFRATLGRFVLKSHILGRLNHINRKLKQNPIYKTLVPEDKMHEAILQDLCLPMENCSAFVEWHGKNIDVFPLWVCPSRNKEEQGEYPLHDFKSDYLVDIGIYTGRETNPEVPRNYYNKLLEKEVFEFKGMKGLYSESYYTEEEFWKLYNKDKYFDIKKKYDPTSTFPDIFVKSIGRKTS